MRSKSFPVNAAVAALVVVGLACLPRSGDVLAHAVGPAPASGAGPPAPPIDVSGASRIEYDDTTQEWIFRGGRVVVVRGTLRIEAPEILYHAAAHQLEVLGRGIVSTPTLEVAADRITAELATRHVTASGSVRGRVQGGASSGGEASSPGAWTTFSADAVEADDRPDAQRIVATGQVVVLRGDQRLQADRVVYDRITQRGTADGRAELARGADRLRADHLVADLDRGEAEARDHVMLEGEDVRGFADHATYTQRTHTAILDGHVILYRGRDRLEAERATILLDEHTTIAEGHPAKIVSGYPGSPPESTP